MYIDRYGQYHNPMPDSIVKDRRGAFAIIIRNEKILVTAGPHAPDVPELPGGGIDAHENCEDALIREIYEETNQELKNYTIISQHNFDIRFYADDVDEYWNYNKQYFVMNVPEDYFFHDKMNTPEGGLAWWEDIKNIEKSPFRATDLIVLRSLGYIE